MKTGCIIQARMTSSRLPGKVLLSLPQGGPATVLDQVVARVSKARSIDQILIATTVNVTDDPLVHWCGKQGVAVFRGSEDHVLSRYALCARENGLSRVVRVTSDCPCIDWELLDELVALHETAGNHYTSNTLDRSFPHGVDAEVVNTDVLQEAFEKATEKFETEHVTPYVYKSHPEKYRIGRLEADAARRGPQIRITLDTPEDYLLLRAVFDLLGDPLTFVTADIVRLFTERPWLLELNGRVQQKAVCGNLDEELAEALRLLKTQDLNRAAEFLREHAMQEPV